ncbi:MAG: exodeoxyribonuclease III, partial [Odoribacter splanchnicus]
GTTGEERQAFKMKWLEDLRHYVMKLSKTRKKLILCGDYNICHRPIDIHDPVRNANSSGFLPEEREWMSLFLESGFTDTFRYFHPEEPHQYTWWSFRRMRGTTIRLAYRLLHGQPEVIPLLKDAYILPQVKHSDHCPAVVELKVL